MRPIGDFGGRFHSEPKQPRLEAGRLFSALSNHMRVTIGKKSEMETSLHAFHAVTAKAPIAISVGRKENCRILKHENFASISNCPVIVRF